MDSVHCGDIVSGIVVAVNNSEAVVDIGTIHTGFISRENLSIDNRNPKEIVEVGEQIRCQIIQLDNEDGIAILKPCSSDEIANPNDEIVENIIEEIKKSLNDMKPGIISEIAISVYSQIENKASKENNLLIKRLSELEERVSILESHNKRIIDLEEKFNNFEQRILKLESTLNNSKNNKVEALKTIENPEPTNNKQKGFWANVQDIVNSLNTLSKTQLDEIYSFPYYYHTYNGWIYYIKIIVRNDENALLASGMFGTPRDRCGELYKVKTDGTLNQKIYSGQVLADEITVKQYFKVNGSKVTFKDAEGRLREIRT